MVFDAEDAEDNLVGHRDAAIVAEMRAVGSEGFGGRRGYGLPGFQVL